MNFSFNGVTKSYVRALRGIERPTWATIEQEIIEVPGRPGGYSSNKTMRVRLIHVPVEVSGVDHMNLQRAKEDVASWLITDEPKPLIFPDEPDRVYFAEVTGDLNLDEILNKGKGVISFVCPDPLKYSSNLKTGIIQNPTGPIILQNLGTAETAPIFDITLKQSTSFLDIIGEHDYMRIGQTPSVDVTPINPKETVLWDQMNSLTGWANAQNSDIDGGTVAGDMRTNGYEFSASSFGTGSSWHGPAKIKSIGQSLTDFEAEFRIELTNEEMKTVGRVELYLLDEAKKAVCKLSLKDNYSGTNGNYAELRIGDRTTNRFLINERGTEWHTWINFNGLLRLSRIGNKWEAYVTKIVDGKHTARRRVEFTDTENKFTGKVAHVVIHLGAHGTIPPAPMKILDLKIHKLNKIDEGQIGLIGEAGDTFTFDHKASAIYKNGELFMEKDFGSRFFKLYKGMNVLLLNPLEVVSEVRAEWRDAYL